MTDRELLELAAKAAGINLDLTLRPDGKPLGCSERGLAINDVPNWWNPLTDNGDALRLAVKLALFESFDFTLKLSAACSEDDPCAATRRAIVRAAAEVGRASHD